jgi:hypothetical protein
MCRLTFLFVSVTGFVALRHGGALSGLGHNGLVHGVLDGTGGGAGEFDEFIDWVFHIWFL